MVRSLGPQPAKPPNRQIVQDDAISAPKSLPDFALQRLVGHESPLCRTPGPPQHVLHLTQLDTLADHKLHKGAFSPAVDTHIIGTALATAHRLCLRPRHMHRSLSSQKVQIEKTNSMSAVVPEGEDQRNSGPASCPFDKRELLRVVHCGRFSCSTDVTARSYVLRRSYAHVIYGQQAHEE